MDSIRQQKIGRFIQKEISELLQNELKHHCKKSLVTVTNVSVTSDLSIAKIYLSVFGVENKQEIVDDISSNQSEIRYLLGKRIKNQVRHIPELHFYQDDSLDYIEKIDKALRNK